jgi:hypothetical protein
MEGYNKFVIIIIIIMQVDGKVYKVIFLEKATITECNIKIKQYSSDRYHKRYLLKRAWTGLFLSFVTFKRM